MRWILRLLRRIEWRIWIYRLLPSFDWRGFRLSGLLRLFWFGLRRRSLFHFGHRGSTAPTGAPSDNAIARAPRRHIQRIGCLLRIGIVRIIRIHGRLGLLVGRWRSIRDLRGAACLRRTLGRI